MLMLGRQRMFTYQIRSREYELNKQKKAFRSLIVIYAATNAQLPNAYDPECDFS